MLRNAVLALIAVLFVAHPAAAGKAPADTPTNTAVFAGGCFWCVEADFEKLPGVVDAVSGYSGGSLENPTYERHTGHREAVLVTYDPAVVSYRALVEYFLRHIDPTDDGGQFCDRGYAYTTAIWTANAEEDDIARQAVVDAEKIIGATIVTPVEPRSKFWIAEDYHQDYYKKNKIKYSYYRTACGRDARVRKIWGAQK